MSESYTFYQKQCGRHPGARIDACQTKRQLELPIPINWNRK